MGSILGKPKAPSVPKADVAGDIQKYVSGYKGALPSIIGAEKQYRPEFLGLNLRDVNQFLSGANGQQGLLGITEGVRQGTQQALEASRQAEMESMLRSAPSFRSFAQQLSPEAQRQVDAADMAAQRATQAARGLTPEETRMSDQASREAFASRGMLNSNSSVASEILGRSGVMAGKRAEADQARQSAFGMAQDFYTRPGLAGLGSAPMAYQLAQQQVGMGLGAIGSATPQMINPDAGVNLGMQQRGLQAQASMAGQAAKSQWQSGLMGSIGQLGGAAVSAGLFSDVRLKEDVVPTGEKTSHGLPIYSFRYIGGKQRYRGVMAQDVQKLQPEAVIQDDSGYLAVDYSLIK